ncbi:protein of unknown function DUF86 [Cellulomonas flavigena DSM 20109]|uniref:DUF86 domain-containing protein n=1 Tax=Cellulomonas flavigena (strain ATCC 482 / DSM 20109 / BCRC 11376 / JCM 18109 / NBRC 3775 / NCIMB 8073 / NRS 134) TaxID=446466 RepID=D5UBY3_CELFN|nr:HepT-like ribonuclease domain-containing protein [Cellulomonas flavigena]ADG76142.1 protein of unknown function DUF86 [Cellulomonas flavigena DSM 20109]
MTADDKVSRLLDDLASIAQDAAHVVSLGEEAYLADDPQGRLLRNAGERIVIKVSTVVERLPQAFKDAHPEVEWLKIQRMRNLIAHHYDKVQADFVWATLRGRIPELTRQVKDS